MKEITNKDYKFWADAADSLIKGLPKLLSAIRTLEQKGYSYNGGEFWKPPIGKKPNFNLIDNLNERIKELESNYGNFLLLQIENQRLEWLIANMMSPVEDVKEFEYDK